MDLSPGLTQGLVLHLAYCIYLGGEVHMPISVTSLFPGILTCSTPTTHTQRFDFVLVDEVVIQRQAVWDSVSTYPAQGHLQRLGGKDLPKPLPPKYYMRVHCRCDASSPGFTFLLSYYRLYVSAGGFQT